jgi:sulfur carrier protein
VNITLNGDPTQVADGLSIEQLLSARSNDDPKRRGIAIARNGEVVPRGRWTSQQLAEGDVVELLTATQGG